MKFLAPFRALLGLLALALLAFVATPASAAGGGTAAQAAREVPEYERAYPDPEVFGTMPSWGVFARHVANLRVRGVELRTLAPDARPAVVLDDVTGAFFADFALPAGAGAARWSLRDVSGLRTQEAAGLSDGAQPDTVSQPRR